MAELSRTPPRDVRRQLRRESGFICAYPGCAEPYLEYHHFDPPWHLEHHHRPEGMIALCRNHHGRAEAYSRSDLLEWKRKAETGPVKAQVEWKADHTAFVVGGHLTVGCEVMLRVDGRDLIWLSRDERGRSLLNFDLRDREGIPAFRMEDSDWTAFPEWEDIEIPPQGRSLHLRAPSRSMALEMRFSESTLRDIVTPYCRLDPPEFFASLMGVSLDREMLRIVTTARIEWPKPVVITEAAWSSGGLTMVGGLTVGARVVLDVGNSKGGFSLGGRFSQ